MSQNPLQAHFRQPELYITLPSAGKFWPEGSVRIPVNGELAVYSMTASDEILMLTPDALMNGEATVQLIQNCVPAIQDAWQTPITDLETLLIAIRIASNGENIDIEAQCPACSHISNYLIDLKYLIATFNAAIWYQPLIIGDLKLHFRPLSYQQHNQYGVRVFQSRKKLNQANLIEDFDQKDQTINQIVAEFNATELNWLIDTIQCIETVSDQVVNPGYISEFVLNCDKRIYNQIKEHVDQLKVATKCSNLALSCDQCSHQFSTELSLDYASFFE